MTASEVEIADEIADVRADDVQSVEPPAKKGPTFETIAVFAFVLSLVAVMVAAFALALAARAIDEHRAIPAGGASSGGSASVALGEFWISPDALSVPSGATLAVVNDGAAPHDLAVEGQDRATPELQAGEEAQLDLSGLAPGSYTLFCQIAGHREAGMVATLTIS